MQEKINYSTKGAIWKLLIDHEERLLWLEIRDEEEMSLSYTCLQLKDGKTSWKELELESTWWSGMIAANHGKLFISKYSNEKNPEPEAVMAIDSQTGSLLWEKEKSQYELATKELVYLSKNEEGEKSYYTIKAENGDISEENSTLPNEEAKNFYDLPLRYFEGEEYFETVKTFLQKKLQVNASKVINYLEKGDKIILSYYLSENKLLSHFMLIMDKKGKTLLHEKLDEELKGIATSNFFVFENLLLFISSKTLLKGIEL